MEFITNFWNDEEGQGMVEYGLILALIAVVVIGALTLMGTGINDIFNNVKSKLVVPAPAGGGGTGL